jgi:hypothetical protein
LRRVLLALADRYRREAGPAQAATLWAATKVLLGLRYGTEQVDQLIEGVRAMILGIRGIEESSVYQDIFAKGEAKGKAEGEAKGKAEGEAKGKAEGRAEEAREALLRLGRKKLGPPEERALATIAALSDLERLNGLLERLLDVSSWDELLAAPAAGPVAP